MRHNITVNFYWHPCAPSYRDLLLALEWEIHFTSHDGRPAIAVYQSDFWIHNGLRLISSLRIGDPLALWRVVALWPDCTGNGVNQTLKFGLIAQLLVKSLLSGWRLSEPHWPVGRPQRSALDL